MDALGFFLRRRRRRPRLKNRFSKRLTFFHTLAHCSILRLCHERGQNKRWGAVRHVKRSGISIRVYSVLEGIANTLKSNPSCSNIYTYIGGDARDIAEPTYKEFNQLLHTNPTAYKGFNQLQGFQPTTKVSTNLIDKNATAYKTKQNGILKHILKIEIFQKKQYDVLGTPKKCL